MCEPGKHIEKVRDIGADFFSGGQIAEILIDPRRRCVVIACRQVYVAAQSARFAPHHERGLAVGFQSCQTVGDVDPVAFQLLGPADVVLLVEARFEFDEDRNLGIVIARLDQRRDEGESLPMRYSVCLIATTLGSVAAARRKSTIAPND